MNKLKFFLKELDIKGKYNKLNRKSKYFEPTLIITLTLLFSFIVICSMKAIMSEEVITISNNAAEEYYYEGKFDEAISEYERIQKENEWPRYKLKMADIYSIKGDYDKSNSLLKEVIIIRNKLIEENDKYIDEDKDLINGVVFTFYMNGQYEEATSLGEDYLKNTNIYKPLIDTLFLVYISNGQTTKAERLIESYPLDSASAYDLSNFAKMQIMVGNIDEGIEYLKKSWDIDSNEVNIVDVMNEVTYYKKEDIIKKVKKLSEENSKESFYKILMAKLYSTSDKTIESAEKIINSVGEKVSLVNVNIVKAEIYTIKDKANEAKKAIEKVIDYDDNSYLSDYLRARLYYNNGDSVKAYEYAKKTIISNDNYDNAWGLLIPEIMNSTKKVELSEAYYRVALSKDPLNYNLIIRIADYYKDIKLNYSKAKEYYLRALRINPSKEELYYALASIELLSENLEGAAEFLEKAIKDETTDGKYYRTLGYVYLKMEENEKAIESIKNAYLLNENDILALNNAAYYYITVEKDIWRGYSNIEAAYNEIPQNLDEKSRLIIEENYNKTKSALDEYLDSGETNLNVPELQYIY